MTDTAVTVPGYVTMIEPAEDRPMAGLVDALMGMLIEDYSLPQPRYATISVGGREIRLQFADDPATFAAMARWTERFGGTLTGERHTNSEGHPQVRCEARFTYQGVNVELYAYITTDTTGGSDD